MTWRDRLLRLLRLLPLDRLKYQALDEGSVRLQETEAEDIITSMRQALDELPEALDRLEASLKER